MADEEYDWDIYEVFKEQVEDQMPSIEASILKLNKEDVVGDAIDDLFRVFHNYKATANYLKLSPLQDISHKAETVLGSLREEKKVVQDSVIEWLLQIKDQLERWLEEMQKNIVDLSEPLEELYQKVKISKSYLSPAKKLKKLTLIYIDDNTDRAKKAIHVLRQVLKDVKYCNSKNYKEDINNFDIVISNLDQKNFDLVEYCSSNFTSLPVITIFDKLCKDDKVKLLKANITQYDLNPITVKMLKKELIFVVKTYFNSKNVLIDNKKITNFIQTLKPLPNTILQIAQVCDDEEMSIGDLVKVVKSDPIIAANILKSASSPMYGSVELKTVDQAIARLGKRAIKALAMDGIYKNISHIDLNPYQMDINVFSKVSQLRLSLMLKWYSKVSIADLSILTSTALLGNIGQLLLSQEIIEENVEENFQKLSSTFDITYAEEAIMHTSTTLVSAQVLNYWELSDDIVNVIMYTNNPKESPKEFKQLAVANYIVYSLVDLSGNICDQIPDEVLNMMADFNFDVQNLQKALDFVRERQ